MRREAAALHHGVNHAQFFAERMHQGCPSPRDRTAVKLGSTEGAHGRWRCGLL
jgi:hypothetical protein